MSSSAIPCLRADGCISTLESYYITPAPAKPAHTHGSTCAPEMRREAGASALERPGQTDEAFRSGRSCRPVRRQGGRVVDLRAVSAPLPGHVGRRAFTSALPTPCRRQSACTDSSYRNISVPLSGCLVSTPHTSPTGVPSSGSATNRWWPLAIRNRSVPLLRRWLVEQIAADKHEGPVARAQLHILMRNLGYRLPPDAATR